MKTSEKSSAYVKHTMFIAMFLLTLQVAANNSHLQKDNKVSTDSSYVVASLSTERVQTYVHSHIVHRQSSAASSYEVIEDDMQLEDWMLSSENAFWSDIKSDVEEEIELEPWMMDAALW